ncbi:MAG: cytochrome c biogenesis protein CcsA [Phycisphaeraceae bacterium]|nr:cytochrome c biogenesis protein CcsA [Phycisphaeraceae bacterium]MBX3367506.1 cytochrome c biogenesis protein CcsA [Phycisphaeraceae bacterium]
MIKLRINTGILAIFLVAITWLPAARSLAQYAPDGNAHPESHAVSEQGASLPSPFGEVPVPSPFDTARKLDLAAKVDLEPLRGLAVFHNGRVKILDTLARETVSAVAGRKNYFDTIYATDADSASKSKPANKSYDPLFTWLDLVIDPAYYLDRPLIHINYLPLRRAFLEAAFPDDARKQERWMKLTRITPVMAQSYGEMLEEAHAFEDPYRDAFGRVRRAMSLVVESRANWYVIAPDAPDLPWHHLSELPTTHPASVAASSLGAAWRAGDADGVNAAARTLAAELPKVNQPLYPTGRAGLELAYNRTNAFEWGYWIYMLSFVSLILAFGTGRKWLIALGVGALIAAVSLHAYGFVLRCMIAERFAIQNQFESMTGLSLFATVVGLAIMLFRRQWLFGAAAAGVGFLVLITATQTGIPGKHIEREAAILNTSVLLKYHVTTVLVSYGLISLGCIISCFYLGVHYARSIGAGLAPTGPEDFTVVAAAALNEADLSANEPKTARERTLKDLDTAQMTVLQLAFWTLGVGILLGGWWADHSWGRWWAFDPKETWALVTWIVYLIVIHLRFTTGRNRGLVTAWLSLIGFIIMLWTYFGVNLLLPGLHAYA